MRLSVYLMVIVVFLTSCSTKTPLNDWKYKSAKAFESYKKYFLKNQDTLAKNSLERAIKHAKQSADLEQLAHIYLGECALKMSVGESSKCQRYEEIQQLIQLKKLNSYYLMLHKKLTGDDIINLPKEYQAFSNDFVQNKYTSSFQAIMRMEKASSKFIAASLMKNYLEKKQLLYLIDTASFYGYKKVVLFWLNQLYILENDTIEKEKIDQKIKLLKQK